MKKLLSCMGILALMTIVSARDFSAEIAAVKAGRTREARAAWWAEGVQGSDMRAALQNALNAGARKLIIDKRKTPWMVSGQLNIPSDIEIVFADGAEIQAMRGYFHDLNESLLMIRKSRNVILRGAGILSMQKKDYQDASRYKAAEWRHTLAIFDSRNVTVEGLTLTRSGGDGVYINRCSGVRLERIRCLDHHRQGISVISVEGLIIRNSEFSGTSGTSPQAGIDFEPNYWYEKLIDCVVENCVFKDNLGAGMEFAFLKHSDRSLPVSITLRNCVLANNRVGVRIKNGNGRHLKGALRFENCRISGSKENTFISTGQRADGYGIHIAGGVFDNTGVESKNAIVLQGGYAVGAIGNLHIRNLQVKDTRPDAGPIYFNEWNFYALRDMTGSLRLPSGKVFALQTLLDDSAKKPPMKKFRPGIQALCPAYGRPLTGKIGNSFRLRFHGEFMQYAEPGEEVVISALLTRIGKPGKCNFVLTSPSGKKVRTWQLTEKGIHEMKFRAQERGVYELAFQGTGGLGVQLRSSRAGNGLSVRNGIGLNHKPGRMYFMVPAGVEKIAFKISGEGGEWVDAELLDASGKVVSSGRKITDPVRLYGQRPKNAPAEVWSLRILRALDDFSIMMVGDSVPVLSTDPEGVLKVR